MCFPQTEKFVPLHTVGTIVITITWHCHCHYHHVALPLPLPLHGIAIPITTWQITKCARACPKQKVRPLHKYSEVEKIQAKNLLFQN